MTLFLFLGARGQPHLSYPLVPVAPISSRPPPATSGFLRLVLSSYLVSSASFFGVDARMDSDTLPAASAAALRPTQRNPGQSVRTVDTPKRGTPLA
ncbi:hypothetical protein P171DRAFT_53599 [Karstenula rhodostoma CBS 690.94]|uniref:Uncharacterized protein n=1 Tax=Karstenula rhodostoma CBS 690.94 TaxID=1392251 RepID=A0A9P4PGL8_9PLEO|nr:hypothetical protein P171DRAFT_53599 [Karstenula rhodostoma CBS 690.94]